MLRVPRLALALACLAGPAVAAPITLSTSGFLLDGSDRPIDSPSATLAFSLWSDPLSTSARVWPASGESACPASIRAGYYAVLLDGSTGSGCGALLDTTHLPGAPRWLEVSIDGVKLSPRTRIGSVPSSADAQALAAALAAGGASVNDAANPVDWKALKGVPAGLADGTDEDTTYTAAAGGGLALTGGAFSIANGGVTNAMLASPSLTVTAGAGLTGGGPVALGSSTSLAMPNVLSNPGVFNHPTITVDAQGRITSASNGSVTNGTVTSVATGAGLTGGPIAGAGTIQIANDGVTNTLLASDAASLSKVSNGLMTAGTVGIGIATTTPAAGLALDVGGIAQAQRLYVKTAGAQRIEVAKSGVNELMVAGEDTTDVYFEVGSKIGSSRAYNGVLRAWGAESAGWANLTEIGQAGATHGYVKSTGVLALQPAGGNVSVGATNASAKLQVRVASQSVDGIVVESPDSRSLYLGPSRGAGGSNPLVQAADSSFIYSAGAMNTGALVIGPWANTPAGLRLDAAGNVGIGTSSPAAKLDVAGTVRSTWDGAAGTNVNHTFCQGGAQTHTRYQAAQVCKAVGMRLCTLADVSAYAEAGYQACCWGWVADIASNRDRRYGVQAYPMGPSYVTTGISESCGGNPGGVRISDNALDTLTSGAHCCR